MDLQGFNLVPAEERRASDPVLDRVLTYFEQKTGGARFACRSDVVPTELKDVLPHVCLIAPTYDGTGALEDLKVTLMGTHVAGFYGELTGKSIFEHPTKEVSDRVWRSAQRCIDLRIPVLAEVSSMSREKNYLRVAVLYVPMSEDGETIDKLFLLTRVSRKLVSGGDEQGT